LTADNIEGVRRVVADGLSVMETEGDAGLAPAEAVPDSPATDAPVADEFYVVQKGDSLSAIAKRLYGDPMAYKRIFEANQGVIKDPNLIYPGQKTLIPRS
jgi:nucleoid-associated protein YgaU